MHSAESLASNNKTTQVSTYSAVTLSEPSSLVAWLHKNILASVAVVISAVATIAVAKAAVAKAVA